MLHALRTEAGFLGVPLPASRCSSDQNIAGLCACVTKQVSKFLRCCSCRGSPLLMRPACRHGQLPIMHAQHDLRASIWVGNASLQMFARQVRPPEQRGSASDTAIQSFRDLRCMGGVSAWCAHSWGRQQHFVEPRHRHVCGPPR